MHLLSYVSVAGIMLAAQAGDPRPARSDALRPARDATAPAARSAADTIAEYRGTYETGFEVSWFHPCDAERGDDTWWVTLTDDALRQRDSLAAKLPAGSRGSVFVRWRGTTSAKMRAGHMGRGSRYMLVSEVLDLRPVTEATCATAAAPAPDMPPRDASTFALSPSRAGR